MKICIPKLAAAFLTVASLFTVVAGARAQSTEDFAWNDFPASQASRVKGSLPPGYQGQPPRDTYGKYGRASRSTPQGSRRNRNGGSTFSPGVQWDNSTPRRQNQGDIPKQPGPVPFPIPQPNPQPEPTPLPNPQPQPIPEPPPQPSPNPQPQPNPNPEATITGWHGELQKQGHIKRLQFTKTGAGWVYSVNGQQIGQLTEVSNDGEVVVLFSENTGDRFILESGHGAMISKLGTRVPYRGDFEKVGSAIRIP